MAGTRKGLFMRNVCLLFVCFYLIAYVNARDTSCLTENGNSVDWFIAYKLPRGVERENIAVNSFFYMDAEATSWHLSKKVMTDTGHAIYNTLDQIYKSKFQTGASVSTDLLYLMYNDEKPEKGSGPLKWKSTSNGHTKGVIAFDDQSGFWLVHSTPHFPPPKSEGYGWPDSAEIYGQTFLCVSMDTGKNLDEIGRQLQYNYPLIYDKSIPVSMETKYPNMAAAMSGKHVTDAPWYRETQLTSLAETPFYSFAKYSEFNADMYSTWLAPRFQETLLVETWQDGINKLCSNCTGKYKVFNIETVQFTSDVKAKFKETQDHAKWAVTNSTNPWTCIGDINRQESQMKRPGGTVCFQNKAVWTNFHSIISTYHQCGPYKTCVPPY